MIKLNEVNGITKETISFGEPLIKLLKEYKDNNKTADYSFACNFLTEIFSQEKISSTFICSSTTLTNEFIPELNCVNIGTKKLEKLVVNYMYQKRKNNLLLNDEDSITNFNILFAIFVLHEVIHCLQYDIVNGEYSVYKEVYGLLINKIENNCNLFNKLIYHINHGKFVNEKSANCYSIQILLEVLNNSDLISKQSLNDFTQIYFNNLIGYYRYTNDFILGECYDTYRLLGTEEEYSNLNIVDIPLFVKMSNGFTLSKDNFEYFKDIICFLKPTKARQIIMKL